MSFNFYWRIRDTKGAGGADGLQKGSFRTSGCHKILPVVSLVSSQEKLVFRLL